MLDSIVQSIYNDEVTKIKQRNITCERKLLSFSYAEEIENIKSTIRKANSYEVERIFIEMMECMFFTAVHDCMYKEKIKADYFEHVPLEKLIYQKMLDEIKSSFNSVSVLEENINREKNIGEIQKIVKSNINFSSLLFLLYVAEWHLPNGWEGLFPEDRIKLKETLEKSKLTMGQFLIALIEYKCACIKEVVKNIGECNLREEYLQRILSIQCEKISQAQSYANADLPVGYFINHTLFNMLEEDRKQKSKIILPNM
jgi:hypothetical protein